MSKLSILHWNDVYRVSPQKLSSRSEETIDVSQFGALLDDLRGQWPERSDGARDGLVLFSGDVFSPSVESSVTRGSHMASSISILWYCAKIDFPLGTCNERACARCVTNWFAFLD